MNGLTELQLCLFGSFQICWDFVPAGAALGRNPQAAKLLQLVLVRRPDPVPAGEAMRLLGLAPENLASALEQVNGALQSGAALRVDDSGQLRFEQGSRCWIDVDAMLSHYRAGVAAASRGDMLPAILAFQEADALYQGALLEEVQEPWVFPLRQELEKSYAAILDGLAEGHAVLARYQDAVGFCQKALIHGGPREETFQRMMVYLYYLGDMSGVHDAYLACCEALSVAGRRASPQTVELYQQLSQAKFPAPGQAAAAREE